MAFLFRRAGCLAAKNGGFWPGQMLNFTLTPTAATSCVGVDPVDPDPEVDCGKMGPHSHVCVKCGGEFAIGLNSAGSANIDYGPGPPGAVRRPSRFLQ
jgi:hypothetical protein